MLILEVFEIETFEILRFNFYDIDVKVKIDRIREFYSDEIPSEVPVLKKSDFPKIEEISNVTEVANFTPSAGNVTNISDKNVTQAINITDIGYVKNMKGVGFISNQV